MSMFQPGDEPAPLFQLKHFLGQSETLGEIWQATSPWEHEVALRIIPIREDLSHHPVFSSPWFRRLEHPHLIRLYGYWLRSAPAILIEASQVGDPFLISGRATELILVTELAQRCLNKRLQECLDQNLEGIPLPELLDYMQAAAEALDYLHQPIHEMRSGAFEALIHGDIKPSNLLLCQGQLKINNTGVSRLIAGATSTSGSSIYFMSPEVIAGAPQVASDQYSLAIVYALLRTGSLPYMARTPGEILTVHRSNRLDLSKLPPRESAVVRRATQLDPQARFPTVKDFVAELRQTIENTYSGTFPILKADDLLAGAAKSSGTAAAASEDSAPTHGGCQVGARDLPPVQESLAATAHAAPGGQPASRAAAVEESAPTAAVQLPLYSPAAPQAPGVASTKAVVKGADKSNAPTAASAVAPNLPRHAPPAAAPIDPLDAPTKAVPIRSAKASSPVSAGASAKVLPIPPVQVAVSASEEEEAEDSHVATVSSKIDLFIQSPPPLPRPDASAKVPSTEGSLEVWESTPTARSLTDLEADRPDAPLADLSDSVTTTDSPGAALFPGSQIGMGHKLVKLLGRGVNGEVWEARKPGGKVCAVKVIRNLRDRESKQEFKSLELMRDLNNPYLLEVEAFWLLDAQGEVVPVETLSKPNPPRVSMLVIATPKAEKNLLQRLKDYQRAGYVGIPLAELLRYMRQAAEAIDYMNTIASIQHRNIRPENLLLTRENTIKVSDFGLAKLVDGDSVRIHSDSVGFTYYYAASEIFNKQVTRWTDQYSLAVTYYKLRTGELPLDTKMSISELIKAHVEGRLELDLLEEPERRVIARATSVQPSQRYDSCMEMVEALERVFLDMMTSGPSILPITDDGSRNGVRQEPFLTEKLTQIPLGRPRPHPVEAPSEPPGADLSMTVELPAFPAAKTRAKVPRPQIDEMFDPSATLLPLLPQAAAGSEGAAVAAAAPPYHGRKAPPRPQTPASAERLVSSSPLAAAASAAARAPAEASPLRSAPPQPVDASAEIPVPQAFEDGYVPLPDCNVEIQYYEQMNLQRLYSLRVKVNKRTNLQEHWSAEATDAVVPLLEIEPLVPGCVVTPERASVAVTDVESEAVFWVTPLAVGNLESPKLAFRHLGQVIMEAPLKIRVVSLWPAWLLLLSALLLPLVLGVFQQEYAAGQTGGFAVYRYLAGEMLGWLSPTVLFCGLFPAALMLFYLSRPRTVEEVGEISQESTL